MYVSIDDFLADLRTGRYIRIKIFNLGENLGMDFAYYCHYTMLKKFFPNVELTLARTNVDETNCIGLESWKGKAVLPVDDLKMAEVKQRYRDESDWVTQLQRGNFGIVSPDFRSMENYDYLCGIGIGESSIWLSQYPENTKMINTSIIMQTIEKHAAEVGFLPNKPVIPVADYTKIKPWARTMLEYMCIDEPTYPFAFTDDYRRQINPEQYSDYIRISLRWPDHVRWYYSIERQYEVIFNILNKLREAGKPVKVMYSLKDGEVGKNFNRGQDLHYLRRVHDTADECLFTYSWTSQPYRGRLSEQAELNQLRSVGLTNVKKVDIWEDLLISSACKTYLSDPGGFAEVISMLRKDRSDSTFLFPVSFGHLCTYITLDKDREPVNLKVNPIVLDQAYDCSATLSAPDDPEGYRTLHWDMTFKDDKRVIGDNCHGDDWKYFEEAQQTVFKDWYEWTQANLVQTVVDEHLR